MSTARPFVLKQLNKGWNTEVISDYLDPAESPDLENVDFSASGSIKKDWGFQVLGSNADDTPAKEMWVFPDRKGIEWLITRAGDKLKIYDKQNNKFLTIKTGLTVDSNLAAEYNDTIVYFASDVDDGFKLDLSKITRLTADVTAGDTTISLASAGALSSSGTVYINDIAVTYGGKSGNDLTGCSNTPDALEGDLVVFETAAATAIPKSSITALYAGRLFVAVGSILYGSKLGTYDDFTVSGSGTGDAILKTLESKINALRVFYDDDNNLRLMAFAANNKIYVIDTIDDAGLGATLTTNSRFKESTTALNQNTTVVSFNDLYHLDLENQVRSLGQKYANAGVNKIYSDSVSHQHRTLFKNRYNFSKGKSIIYNNHLWITAAYGDSDINNRLLIVNLTTGAWRQRTDINANWLEFYEGRVVFSDASTNKIMELREGVLSANDEDLMFRYSTLDIDTNKLCFERLRRVRVSGFISTNCESKVEIFRDFGTIKIGEFLLKGDNIDITGQAMGEKGIFGTMLFGGEMVGGEDGGLDTRFFIADLELKDLPDIENFRLVFTNKQANVYFEITAIKPFQHEMAESYFPSKYIQKNN